MKMILLSLVMLLIAFEPAFSGKIMNKLDKELKKMGLKKLKKSLAKIGTNADEIDSNKARIDNNTVDIGDGQNDINALKADVNKLESTNDFWFDAYRHSEIITYDAFVTVTYDALRGSSQSSSNNAMDITTGIFRAPYAGAFEFMFQGYKYNTGHHFGMMQLTKNSEAMSFSESYGTEDNLFGTAILNLDDGDRVWVETKYSLFSNEKSATHFTGKMLKSA